MNKQELSDFLKTKAANYLATVEDGEPRVRGGHIMSRPMGESCIIPARTRTWVSRCGATVWTMETNFAP